MKALLTVSERIAVTLAKAKSEGNVVNRFFLGKSEMECLMEWADDGALIELGLHGKYRGQKIYQIDKPSYFAYELVELASV